VAALGVPAAGAAGSGVGGAALPALDSAICEAPGFGEQRPPFGGVGDWERGPLAEGAAVGREGQCLTGGGQLADPVGGKLRSVWAALLPIITGVTGVGLGLLVVVLGSHLVSLSSTSITMGSLIGLGVGIDYALFIVRCCRG
jgi:hypothetical protein